MLYFHIAQRCLAFSILDDIMKRQKNAYFYINPFTDIVHLLLPYCLPKHVIATCIKPLTDDYCEEMTADLVQDYLLRLLYIQDWFGQAFRSAGLFFDICTNDIDSNYTLHALDISVPHIPSLHGRLGFLRLLEMSGPWTALNTVWGKFVIACIQTLPGEELCTPMGSYLAYQACVMSSDSKSEVPTFSVLQFAHTMINQCSRLEPFTIVYSMLEPATADLWT